MVFENIAQEIIDDIVVYLWHDKQSLKAASLTCWSFVPPCQKQLFSKIDIAYGTLPTRLPSAQQLCRLITWSPHIPGYVKCLTILEREACNFLGVAPPNVDGDAGLKCLSQCLPLFHNLKVFAMTFSPFPYSFSSVMTSPLVLAVLDILQQPSLEYVEFKHGSPLLLNSGTTIKHLALRNTLWHDERDTTDDAVQSIGNTAVESLLIQDFNDGLELRTLVDWVLFAPNIDSSRLRRLNIDAFELIQRGHFQIQRILVNCSATLEDLILRPSIFGTLVPGTQYRRHDESTYIFSDSLDFGVLRCLRRLHLSVQVGIHGWGLANPYPWVLGILRTLPTPNVIEEIVIHTTHAANPIPPADQKPVFPWHAFATLLSSTVDFTRLRKVLLLHDTEREPSVNASLSLDGLMDISDPHAVEMVRCGMLEITSAVQRKEVLNPLSFYPQILLD